MKKKTLKNLELRKKSISNLANKTGGIESMRCSIDMTCTGMAGCTFDSKECTTEGNYSCQPCNQQ